MGSIFQADRHICCFPFRVREIIVFFPGVVTEIITFSAHCFSKLLCSKQAATQTCSFFFLLHISFVFSASLLLCHYWELFLQRMIQACSDHSNILIIHKLYHSWSRVYNWFWLFTIYECLQWIITSIHNLSFSWLLLFQSLRYTKIQSLIWRAYFLIWSKTEVSMNEERRERKNSGLLFVT